MKLFGGYELKKSQPVAAVAVVEKIPEQRGHIENPNTPLSEASEQLFNAFGMLPSDTGMVVNEETALRFSALYACVRILSESIAALPLHLYRRTANGKEKAVDHPLYWLMHDQPNDDQTSYYFRETKQAHVSLHGNAYSYIEFQRNGRPNQLITLPPTATWAQRKSGIVTYHSTINGEAFTFSPDQILHIPALGFDGLMGKSPLSVSREAIGLGLAAQKFGAKFFENGARLSGVLEHPGKLSDAAKTSLKNTWAGSYQGMDNTAKVAVLEEGLKFNQLSIPPEDAQYLETRKFQVTDIARIFRIPPHMLADLERATFSNIEQQGIEFVIHSLLPWLVRWEQELNKKLLLPGERKTYFFKFQIDALLRGDIKSRYEAYQLGRNGGWLSVNDIREMDDMNRVEGGDVYLQQMNMQATGAQKNQPQDPLQKNSIRLFSIIDRVAKRYGRKQSSALKRIIEKKSCDPKKEIIEFYEKLSRDIQRDMNISVIDADDYCARMLLVAESLSLDFDVEVVAEDFATDLLLIVNTGESDGK